MGRTSRLARLAATVSVITFPVLAAVGGAGPTRAAVQQREVTVTSLSIAGQLTGVAAASAGNAWAVGYTVYVKTIILHWNGEQWAQVTTPKPVRGVLNAVTAVSPDDVWAVGATLSTHSGYETLIMHWNGSVWSQSGPVIRGELWAVAASGSNVWAVGDVPVGGPSPTGPLILHRVGDDWYVVPVDDSAGYLAAAGATSGSAAWAAGDSGGASQRADSLLRWNGALWESTSFPLQGAYNSLVAMAAGPHGAIWAVGSGIRGSGKNTTILPLSMRWDGKEWHRVPVPVPYAGELEGVTFVPGGTAWAAGWQIPPPPGPITTFILRWTGESWVQVATPSSGQNGAQLSAVAATSASDAWAVGFWNNTKLLPETLILHWNGESWS